MDTADTRLTGLALAWLFTRGKRPGTRKELERALRPLVEHRCSRAECAARFEALVDELPGASSSRPGDAAAWS